MMLSRIYTDLSIQWRITTSQKSQNA